MEKQYQEQGEREGLLYSMAVISTELGDFSDCRSAPLETSPFVSCHMHRYELSGAHGNIQLEWFGKEHNNHELSIGGRGNPACVNIWYWT